MLSLAPLPPAPLVPLPPAPLVLHRTALLLVLPTLTLCEGYTDDEATTRK